LQSRDAALALIEVLKKQEPGFFAAEMIGALHGVVSSLPATEVQGIVDEKILSRLVATVQESLKPTKLCALELIGLLGLNQGVSTLLSSLELESEELRLAAATSLARLKQADIAPYLRGLADPKKPLYTKEAYLSVAAAVFAEEAAGLFQVAFESQVETLVVAALTFLPETLGLSFAEMMEQKMLDPQPTVRLACAAAMGRIGAERFVGPLVKQLNMEEDTEVQEAIDSALIQIGSSHLDSKIRPYLQSFTAEERALALGRYGFEKLLSQKEKMIEGLSDPHFHLQIISFKLLANLGQLTEWMIEKGLEDSEIMVQIEAARGIGSLLEKEKQFAFLKRQMELNKAYPERVQVELIQQAARIGGGLAGSLLHPFLHSSSVWVKVEAVEALKGIGEVSIIPQLKQLLEGAEGEFLDVLEQAIYELESV